VIFGIGTDIVEVARIESVYKRRGDRFAKHVLHEREWSDFEQSKQKHRFLAKRFAVKEAATKALGTGQAQSVLLRHFYVTHNSAGKPELFADACALEQCQQAGVNKLHVSIADETHYATAQVILEAI